MEIVTQQLGEALEVKVRGRLDNYWTEHLRASLDEIIRNGAHGILLNLSEVSFLSSAGVGLLVGFHGQLKGIGGSFLVTQPSPRVQQVLELCRLTPLLLHGTRPSPTGAAKAEARRISSPHASYEITDCKPAQPLVLHRIGDPSLLHGCRFSDADCRSATFPPGTFGLGLGAFGEGFDDARTRFGEFMAAAGAAAYLPTDGTNVPDFMVASGELVPDLNVLYGLQCTGGFSHVMRFESAGPDTPLALAELTDTALSACGAPLIGMVMLAESAGLVGAALRRSPAATASPSDAPFRYPEVRSWLSFSTERLHARSLVLISGIAASSECAPLQSWLRRVGPDPWPAGHFHAAAFSYRPLRKGEIDLNATVAGLFESETLQGVLHLLADSRQAAGPLQSEFVRGACWIGPASEIR